MKSLEEIEIAEMREELKKLREALVCPPHDYRVTESGMFSSISTCRKCGRQFYTGQF